MLRRPERTATIGAVTILALLLAASLYFLSMGPVLAYAKANPEGLRYLDGNIYLPLVRLALRATARYVNLWGVTDIELHLMYCGPQREHQPESRHESQ